MVEMTSEERVLRVLQRQEPDRIPHFEWIVDHRVREALCPGCKDYNDFAVEMEHDAIIVDLNYKKERVGTRRWLSEWGYVSQDTDEEHGVEVESPIKTMSDFDGYTAPDPHLAERFTYVEDAVQKFAGIRLVLFT
ncbi:MAG: hypothetical protein H8D34_20000 [Chloroflexi bacterium]|nr:hypothetical protein [Chloroflexota bacterium]